MRAGLDHADDGAIWAYAGARGLTIVTLDADFAELATLRGPPPKVIWLRCGNLPTDSIGALLRRHAVLIAQFVQDADTACLELS